MENYLFTPHAGENMLVIPHSRADKLFIPCSGPSKLFSPLVGANKLTSSPGEDSKNSRAWTDLQNNYELFRLIQWSVPPMVTHQVDAIIENYKFTKLTIKSRWNQKWSKLGLFRKIFDSILVGHIYFRYFVMMLISFENILSKNI